MAAENPNNSSEILSQILGRNFETLMQIAAEQGIDSKVYQIMLAIAAVDPEIPLLEAQKWLSEKPELPEDIIKCVEIFFQERPIDIQVEEIFGIYRREILDWIQKSPVRDFSDEERKKVTKELHEMEAAFVAKLQRNNRRRKS